MSHFGVIGQTGQTPNPPPNGRRGIVCGQRPQVAGMGIQQTIEITEHFAMGQVDMTFAQAGNIGEGPLEAVAQPAQAITHLWGEHPADRIKTIQHNNNARLGCLKMGE